jgi:filamentous hemagglutinin family protein
MRTNVDARGSRGPSPVPGRWSRGAGGEPAARLRLRQLSAAVAQAFALGALSVSLAQAQAPALPSGGQVVGGAAVIGAVHGNALTVTQSSQRAAIDWQSFNIGAGHSVSFLQPSASAAILNRVIGGNPSEILGRMSANGQVFLLNPSGILIGRDAQIDVGGFVGSTLNLSNADFLAGGRLPFANGGSAGSIVNHGSIRTPDGGAIVFIAPRITNTGTLVADRGSVGLAAGERVSLDFRGDGLLRMSVDAAVLGAAIAHSGTLQANGGRVQISAETLSDAMASVINLTGIVRAHSLVERNGEIHLSGGSRGVVALDGASLEATGQVAGTRGGSVAVLGDKIGLFGATRIDASGEAGGGTVLVGGNFQGRGPEQNAFRTYVGSGATINADAVTHGDGGRVIVWADDVTRFAGAISARGGAQGGNGGFAEVSGKRDLIFRGTADLSAANGTLGILLLDPRDITVAATGAATLAAVDAFADTPGDDVTIAPATINAATATVVLQANRDVHVNDAIAMTTAGAGLTIQAGRDIHVNAGISTTNGAISLTANDSTSITTTNHRTDGSPGDITVAAGMGIHAGTSSISMTIGPTAATVGAVTFNPGQIALGTGTLTAAGGITLTATHAASVISNAAGGMINVNGSVLTVNHAGTGASASTLAGVIAGAGGLTKAGPGTLILSGANTYSGTTTISRGVLQVGAGTGTGTLGTGAVTNNASLVFNRNDALTVANAISGKGSLRQTGTGTTTLAGANTYSGATTVSAGVLRAGSTTAFGSNSAVTVTSPGVLDLAGQSLSIGSLAGNGTVTLGAGTLTTGALNTSTTYSGVISGTGGLTKIGTGALTLTGTNIYEGTTTISGGVLRIGAGGATGMLGTGEVINNAVLDFRRNNLLTVANNISGTGNLRQTGTGTTILTGLNTYTGPTTVSAGVLRAGSTTAFGSNSAVTVTAPGALDLPNHSLSIGSLAGSGNVTLGAVTLTTGALGTNTTYSGIISGIGGLTKVGTGILTLTGTNIYEGTTTISGGVLRIGAGGATGTLGTGGVINNAVLDFRRDNPLTVANNISGTGNLLQTGTGTTTLTGTNIYTGATTVSAGVLRAGSAGAFSPSSAFTVGSGTTLDLNNTNQSVASLAGSGNVTLGSGTLTVSGSGNTSFGGAITSTTGGGLTRSGSGTLTLTGSGNNYNGATLVTGTSTLELSGAGALTHTSAVTVDSGSIFRLAGVNSDRSVVLNGGTLASTGTSLLSGGVTLAATGVVIDVDMAQLTISGVIGGGNGFGKQGTGTLTLTGNNTYTGTTTISSGVLQVGDGGTLGTPGAVTVTDPGSLVFNRSDALLTVANNIGGTGSLTQAGTGTTTLTGNNTYTGATTVNAGVLRAGSTTAFGLNSAVTVNAPGALDLPNHSLSIGSLAGSGNVTLGAVTLTTGGLNANTTYSGVISGDGGLTQTGTGTLTLTGTNTYSGATLVTGPSTLELSGAGALTATSAVTVDSGSTFRLADATSDRSVVLNGGTLASTGTSLLSGGVTLAATGVVIDVDMAQLTISGVIGGTYGFTKQGPGTLTLTGNNTYTGTTTISSGVLQVGDGGTTGALAGNVVNHSVLIFHRSDAISLPGVLTGDGALTLTTPGDVTLNNPGNSFSAPIVLAGAGNVQIANSAATTLGNVTASAFTLSSGGAVSQTPGAALVVSGPSSVTTSSTITLANDGNNFVGPVTLSGSRVDIHDGTGGITLGNVSGSVVLITATMPPAGGQAISQVAGTTWTVPDIRLLVLNTTRSAAAGAQLAPASPQNPFNLLGNDPRGNPQIDPVLGNGNIGSPGGGEILLVGPQKVTLGFGAATAPTGQAWFLPPVGGSPNPGNFLTDYSRDNTFGLTGALARQAEQGSAVVHDALQRSQREQIELTSGTGVLQPQLLRDSQELGPVADEIVLAPGIRLPEGIGVDDIKKR